MWHINVYFVRMEGLEPPRLTAPDPKSGAATNYATSGFQLKFPSKGAQIYDVIGIQKSTFSGLTLVS
jgi:hypothetical protein